MSRFSFMEEEGDGVVSRPFLSAWKGWTGHVRQVNVGAGNVQVNS